MKQNNVLTYSPSKQWAALTTYLLSTSVPPQVKYPEKKSCACQGQAPRTASSPLTIRLFASVGWRVPQPSSLERRIDKFRHCLKTVLVAQLLNHYTHSTNAHDEGPGRGLQPWPSCSLLVCIFLVFSQVVFFSIRCIGCCHSAGSWGIYLSKCDFVMFECKVLFRKA